jgi:hypothetical protein
MMVPIGKEGRKPESREGCKQVTFEAQYRRADLH